MHTLFSGKGTRCQKHLFSLSLSPPPNENVPVVAFEAAIDRIEGELGLSGQPRAIVFHEKEGRRHAHAVWSRIDGEEMKAINMPFHKRTLNGIARDLYREHGWEMPRGFKDTRHRDPLSFTRDEWQQAMPARSSSSNRKRAGWKKNANGPLECQGAFVACGVGSRVGTRKSGRRTRPKFSAS